MRRESELGPVDAAFDEGDGCAVRLLGRCGHGAGSRYRLNMVAAVPVRRLTFQLKLRRAFIDLRTPPQVRLSVGL